ncbi:MAG: type IV pilin N-terminal domain-containing protein [Methanocalculus sp.]|uniref:type IV pilin N-terminal domain-containing protein n=1 Tax=Methanocalculus sp. TaxID=2004547 RepID=UPI002722E48A|nr:type IV pilin N-terminal domain-containing protein [Methanocalculus sp.]MDO9539824.1 type IV pilin N-terminal domain-containing protein [Methanocalculus sp.]
MTGKYEREAGVSEVVGEMLMIGLAILLIAVFSSVLGNFLPAAHDPSVTILMTHDRENVTLWHKGGDWVKIEDLTVVIGNDTSRRSYTQQNARFLMVPKKTAFDLGSNITITTGTYFAGDETVSLVTPRAKIFSGTVHV